jgi:hypothetical protein
MARDFALDLIAVLSFGINAPGNPSYMVASVPIVALVRLTDLNLVSLQDMVLTHRCNKATLGNDLTGYSAGLIETGASRLPRQEDTVSSKLPYQGSIEEQILKCKSRSDAEVNERHAHPERSHSYINPCRLPQEHINMSQRRTQL